MKHLLLTTIAAVLVVGCGESQLSAPAPETKPEPPAAKAPNISIHDAVEKGNIEAVKQHIAAGTDVNAKGGVIGGTPLHGAVAFGHKEIVELLIAEGADVNAKVEVGDYKGQTPLDGAIQWSQTATADLLRKHGGKTSDGSEDSAAELLRKMMERRRQEVVE